MDTLFDKRAEPVGVEAVFPSGSVDRLRYAECETWPLRASIPSRRTRGHEAGRAVGSGAKLVDDAVCPPIGRGEALPQRQAQWLALNRPRVRHTLVAPGPKDSYDGAVRSRSMPRPCPSGDGYRWPVSKAAWMKRLMLQRPSLIEAGDPYTPGLAALGRGGAGAYR